MLTALRRFDFAMKLARFSNGTPEIFRTLQGEGPSTGCPSVFLRLSLCNLHCIWCDTPFTWNWEGTPWEHQDLKKFSREEQILELDVEEIARKLEKPAESGDNLVITGGEPLLQQQELILLLEKVRPFFSKIEIETNGTQKPLPELERFISQYNVSPKLRNSQNSEKLRISSGALAFFAASKKAFFKFVIQSKDDIEELLELRTSHNLPTERILLMPEGRTPEALAKNRHWIAHICLQHGFRMTDRLHVQLWGDERGR